MFAFSQIQKFLQRSPNSTMTAEILEKIDTEFEMMENNLDALLQETIEKLTLPTIVEGTIKRLTDISINKIIDIMTEAYVEAGGSAFKNNFAVDCVKDSYDSKNITEISFETFLVINMISSGFVEEPIEKQFYHVINGFRRNNTLLPTNKCQIYFNLLNDCLELLPVSKKPETIYRQLNLDNTTLQNLKVNDVWDMSFSSSNDTDLCENSMDKSNRVIVILHNVDPSCYRNISKFSYYENENDIMIMQDCFFTITEIVKIGKYDFIHMHKA